jgi:hypothetical protein
MLPPALGPLNPDEGEAGAKTVLNFDVNDLNVNRFVPTNHIQTTKDLLAEC